MLRPFRFATPALGALVVLSACSAESDDQLRARAAGIHSRALTIDTHDDIPFNFATDSVDPGIRGERQVDIPKMQEGELDAAFFVVYVGQTERTADDEQLLALKENGGVIQMVALGGYVKVQPAERGEALAAIREEMGITGGFGGLRNLAEDQRAVYDRRVAELDERWPRASVEDGNTLRVWREVERVAAEMQKE